MINIMLLKYQYIPFLVQILEIFRKLHIAILKGMTIIMIKNALNTLL